MNREWTNYQRECLFEGTKVYYKPGGWQLTSEGEEEMDCKIPEKWLNKDGTVLMEIVEPCCCVSVTVYERDGKAEQDIRSYISARVVRAGPESGIKEFLVTTGIVSFKGVEKTTV